MVQRLSRPPRRCNPRCGLRPLHPARAESRHRQRAIAERDPTPGSGNRPNPPIGPVLTAPLCGPPRPLNGPRKDASTEGTAAGAPRRGCVTLRKRTLLAVGGMLAALLVGLSLVSSTMLLGGFRRLDEERSRSELHRVLGSIDEKLASLRAVSVDWAFWDDTYRFAAGEQPDYEAQNLADESLATLSLNLFAVIDTDGRFVFATGFDPEKKTRLPLPAGIDSVLRAMPAYSAAGARGIDPDGDPASSGRNAPPGPGSDPHQPVRRTRPRRAGARPLVRSAMAEPAVPIARTA